MPMTKDINAILMAAEQGDLSAQYHLGECFEHGDGVTEDIRAAARWYSMAADQGDIESERALKRVEQEIRNNMMPNYFILDADVNENIKAAERGDTYAQGMLAYKYNQGIRVEHSYENAVYWWTKAAMQDDPQAQFNLAECYELGHGVPKDIAKATEWYEESASNGFVEAKRALVRISLERSGQTDSPFPFLHSYISLEDREEEQKDEYGIRYSKDKVYLHSVPKNTKKCVIPDGTKVISDGAFSECDLRSVNNPSSVVQIGKEAFCYCYELSSIKLPKQLKEIGEEAFSCTKLRSIAIPDSVTVIGEKAFANCRELESIIIPKNVVDIGRGLFMGSKKLSSVIVDENNPVYNSRENCNAIIENETGTLIVGCHTTSIPNGVKKIGVWAFRKCEGLASIVIPEGVTEIENGAFNECKNLKTVVIADSVTKIGNYAFQYCESLVSVVLPKHLEKLGENVFEGCNSLKEINLPQNLKRIGGNAFERCMSLQSLILPDSLVSIGDKAFMECHRLAHINIPVESRRLATMCLTVVEN